MKQDIKSLETEQHNHQSTNIDKMNTLDILKTINNEDKQIPSAIHKNLNNIEKVVDESYKSLKDGGRLIYIGAGTSGRLGVLDASECPPTYGVTPDLVQGIMAGGNEAIFRAQEGVEDRPEEGEKDLKEINLTEKDMVIGITASGRTPYVLGALNYANSIQAGTSSISCASYSEVSDVAQFPIEIITGPEVVTGSTRMKAGTAQKLVLNMISTMTMIGVGKVYDNLMVDLRPTNQKLIHRSIRIIQDVCDLNHQEAIELYEKLSEYLPNDHEVEGYLGYLYYENSNLDEAEERLKNAIYLSEKEPFLLFLLGNVYSRKGMIKEALDCYELAIFLDFDMYGAHIDFGRKYEHMGRHEKALKEFRAAYEIDSRDEELLNKIKHIEGRIEEKRLNK